MDFPKQLIFYLIAVLATQSVPVFTYAAEQNEGNAPVSLESDSSDSDSDIVVQAAKPPLSDEDQIREDKLKEGLKGESPAREALDLMHYNIYFHLPKVSKEFDVLYGPYPKVYYGPYEVEKKIYVKPWLTPEEINQRIDVLKDTIEKENQKFSDKTGEGPKKEDPLGDSETSDREQALGNEIKTRDLLYQRIHLADLMTIRSRITGRKSDVHEAVRLYADVFSDTSGDFFPYVALNFVNSLLLKQDVITALPVIKKIYREYRSQKDFMRHLNTSMIDLYFLSGRYHKMWEELEKKIQQKTIDNETQDFKIRVGDVLFFMKRYREAAEWYQSVLKPNPQATLSENLSWLYLAESVYLVGDREVALKIYETMLPYFRGTPYEDVINYRVDASIDNGKRIVQYSQNQSVRNWIRVEMMRVDFIENPQNYSLENFNVITAYGKFDDELMQQVQLMKAWYEEIEGDHMAALKLYTELLYKADNPYLSETLTKAVANAVMRRGLETSNEMEAIEFLRFLRKFEFSMRFEDSDHIYSIVMHNMRILGMMDVAAGQALHIIDKTVHTPSAKMSIYLKMSVNLFNARADKSVVKVMDMIDTNLLDLDDRQKYNRLRTDTLIRAKKYGETLAFLDEWSAQGNDAEMLYWIVLRKVEVLEKMERYSEALGVIENSIGEGKIEELPPEYDVYTDPLIAYQVIFNNKKEKNYESLLGFYANQDRAMRSKMKLNVILSAISSALALNKPDDVKKLMNLARENFNDEIYTWLDKWTRGEMWVNQISSHLEGKDVANSY